MNNELVKEIIGLLSSCGYQVFVSLGRRSVFDILGRKNGKIFLIKVLENIDGLKEDQARDLRNLAAEIGAIALLIGIRSKSYKLMDGVIYARYGLTALTLETLFNALRGEMPEKRYWKGKVVSNIDRDAIENLIERNTINKVAEALGVSKEAVYMYKTGRMNMEYSKAKRLEEEFNTKITNNFNIFTLPKVSGPKPKLNGYLQDLEKLGFEIMPIKRSFDAVAKECETLVLAKEKTPNQRKAEFLKKTGKLLDSHPVIVTESKKDTIHGIAVLRETEIKEIKKAKEIINLVNERELI